MKKARESSPTARKVAKDVFTIPNFISMIGAALVMHGSEKIDTPEGLAECAVGRLADVLDGKVARMTGQTSNFGAMKCIKRGWLQSMFLALLRY